MRALSDRAAGRRVRLTATGRWAGGAGTAGVVLGAVGELRPVFGAGAAALLSCAAAWAAGRFGRRPGVAHAPPARTEFVRGERLPAAFAPAGRPGSDPPTIHGTLEDALPGGSRTLPLTGRGWTLTSPALPRGVWRLGPAVAQYRDPLGLAVTRTEPSPPGAGLTVRPRTTDALPWVAEAAAAHASGAARLDTYEAFEIHGMRRHVPGDDLRLIDWRSTLRTGAFHVRERRGGGTAPAVVLLDTAAGEGEAFETAVDCAAAVALSVLRLGRPVTLAVVGAEPRLIAAAPGARDAVLDLLTRVRPRPAASATPATRLAAAAPGGALAVLSTTRDPALWRPALSALSAHRATVVCVHATAAPTPADSPLRHPGFRTLRVSALSELADLPAPR
ncbi:DUF58 domain-containing protein [Streptomyces sp. NPDC049040]|uniref:DUF58 domain-containing protein n=1 Tax=Streptomyces sp. NPDC049040 TaxID=3365593 RepID=UPI00371407A2